MIVKRYPRTDLCSYIFEHRITMRALNGYGYGENLSRTPFDRESCMPFERVYPNRVNNTDDGCEKIMEIRARSSLGNCSRSVRRSRYSSQLYVSNVDEG